MPLNQFSEMDLFERTKVSVIYLFVVRGTNLFSKHGYLCVYGSWPIYAFGKSAFSTAKRVRCCSASASECMYCRKMHPWLIGLNVGDVPVTFSSLQNSRNISETAREKSLNRHRKVEVAL